MNSNLRLVRGGDAASASATEQGNTGREEMLSAVEDYVETTRASVVPALQPAFAAQAEHVLRAVNDLTDIARRGQVGT